MNDRRTVLQSAGVSNWDFHGMERKFLYDFCLVGWAGDYELVDS